MNKFLNEIFDKVLNSLSFVALIYLFGTHSLAQAFQFTHRGAQELSHLIQTSIEKNDSTQIQHITSCYRDLRRWEVPVPELIELKFQMQHWRERMLRDILAGAGDKSLNHSKYRDLLVHLNQLNLVLDAKEFEILDKSQPAHFEAATVWFEGFFRANQSNTTLIQNQQLRSQSRLAGPDYTLDMSPLKPSPTSFDSWSRIPSQLNYEIHGEEVSYRGLELRPGDMFLVDINTESSLFLSSMTERESYLPHFSIFILFEVEGRRVPGVLQISGRGLRVVPLNVFFSPQYSSYIEIFRMNDLTENQIHSLNKVAQKFITERCYYDLTGTSRDEHEMQCPGVGKVLFDRIGYPAPEPRSVMRSGVDRPLSQFGVKFGTFLSASDYALDPRAVLVGVIDNRGFKIELARQLVVHEIGQLLQLKELVLENLPIDFKKKASLVGHIQRGGILANLALYLGGFTPGLSDRFGSLFSEMTCISTFPRGSAEVLAIIPISDRVVKKAVREISTKLSETDLIRTRSVFSLHEFQDSPEVQIWLKNATTEIRHWFGISKEN